MNGAPHNPHRSPEPRPAPHVRASGERSYFPGRGGIAALLSFAAALCAPALAKPAIAGSVVNWVTRMPIAGATVTLTCGYAHSRTVTTTDANGRFRLAVPNMSNDDYDDSCELTTAKDGLLPVSRSRLIVSINGGNLYAVGPGDLQLGLAEPGTATNAPHARPSSAASSGPQAGITPDAGATPPARSVTDISGPPAGITPQAAITPAAGLNYAIQHVYFATDRSLVCACAPSVAFGGEQNAGGALRYGEADVSIPRDHRLGGLESPSFWRFEFRADPVKHILVLSSHLDTAANFQTALRSRISQAPKHDAFVFIHGYNVTFDDALRRTAQLAHDLNIPGPAISFSWPAKGELADYVHDENNIAWATPHLEAFLESVARTPGISTIRVIAHSMGNRALAEALADVGKTTGRLAHVDSIVLAAPDIDDGRFEEIAAAFRRSVPHITIYASATDKALQASHRIHGYPRLGDAAPIPLVMPGFDVVDVSAIDTDWLGHGYFSTSVLMQDMYNFFLGNEPPRFGLERAVAANGQAYWRFVHQ